MMKGCSKVAYAFVTLLITYSSAANTFTAQSSFLNFLQRYNKYLKYTRILAIKCNFICILCYKALLFAQLCDCIFGGFLIYKGVPTIQQIFVYFFFDICKFIFVFLCIFDFDFCGILLGTIQDGQNMSEGDLYFHIVRKVAGNEFGYISGNLLIFPANLMSITIKKVEFVLCKCVT